MAPKKKATKPKTAKAKPKTTSKKGATVKEKSTVKKTVEKKQEAPVMPEQEEYQEVAPPVLTQRKQLTPGDAGIKNLIMPTDVTGFDRILNGGFSPGTCMLFISPPLIESRLFVMEFVYRGLPLGEPGIVITTNSAVEDLKIKAIRYGWNFARYEQMGILRWIDTYSIYANRDVKSTNVIDRIGGPLALTDISIAMAKIQTDFHKKKEYYRLAFDSLSTLLTFNKPETIYRFLRDTVAKIRASGGIAIFTIDDKMHAGPVVETIKHMMDGVMRLTQSGETLELSIESLPLPGSGKKANMTMDRLGFVLK